MKSLLKIAVLITLLGQPALGLSADDTVPTIPNPGEPLGGEREVVLEELWRFGTDEDDPLLGVIERVLLQEDGGVLLLDTQLSRVLECDPAGRFLRTLGGPGQGPGELTGPVDLVRFDDGVLGLVGQFPGKLILLDDQGNPAGSVDPVFPGAEGNFLTLHRALTAGPDMILGGSVMTMDPNRPVQVRTFFLGRFDREGHLLSELATGSAEFDMRSGELHEAWEKFVWNRMAVRRDGSAVVAIPRDRFELTFFDREGRPILKADLPRSSWRRNDRARDRALASLKPVANHIPGVRAVPAATAPVVADVSVRENGDVWCLTSEEMWNAPEGRFATYDVLDGQGHFRQRVHVVCEGDPTRDKLLFAADRVFRIVGYWDAVNRVEDETPDPDAEPMSVVCYRIPGL